MEGHPGYEDRGATRVFHPIDSSAATRKRVFLLLEGERGSLTAGVRPPWRPGGRYEDLSLVIMLARFERDWLARPGPPLGGGDRPSSAGDQPAHRLAGWAMPWGAAPRSRLEADIDGVDGALERLGRWLPGRTVARAKKRAQERLAAITTGLEEPGPAAWQAAADDARRPPRKLRGLGWPQQARAASIAALLLLAVGAGAFLLASRSGSGPADSVGRLDAAGPGGAPGAIHVPIHHGSGQRGRAAGEPAGPPGRPEARGQDRASSNAPAESAPVASEQAPPAPEPAPVPQPVASPQPAPAPPPGSASSPATSQAKSASGCPPEFGYEC